METTGGSKGKMADVEAFAEEGGEEPVELTAEVVSLGLCEMGKTMDGKSVALIKLDLPSMRLGDIAVLAAMENVRHVDISGNLVKDLSPLHGLKQLLSLNASGNKIETVSLPRMEFMQLLDLSRNMIKGAFSGLDMPCLRHLKLSQNEIESVAGLEGSTQLQRLDLEHNKLASSEGIGLGSLMSISLNNNALADVKGLTGLIKITSLSLMGNVIVTLEGLPRFGVLTKLGVGQNQVATFEEGVRGFVPGSVTELDLSENPIMEGIDRVKILVEIQGLKILNTVPITDDERTAADLILNPPPEETLAE